MIHVAKPFLPPLDEYTQYLKRVWDSQHLTNQGELLTELEDCIKNLLGVEHFHYLTNGTVSLQLALRALDIVDSEIIVTPFTYVATVSSILWERNTPIFVDIDQASLCIDANLIESAITPRTKAILAVHVFGYACDVEMIAEIAKKHSLRVIYDGAHAFASNYKGQSLLSYGDITTLSFHATKVFHTAEGGGCVVKSKRVSAKLDLQKRFGHIGDNHYELGINAKNSELHAAMGLALLPYLQRMLDKRRQLSDIYDSYLSNCIQRPIARNSSEHNYAYYPIIFGSELKLLNVFDRLSQYNVFPRRYFYPSLNNLPYVRKQPCPVAEDIANRIACLPLYFELDEADVVRISKIILLSLQ